jgi:hypothetical protein
VARVAFAVHILPGKTEQWMQMCQEIAGPRKDAWQASRQRRGITSETAHLQRHPQGDTVVVVLEGEDIEGAFAQMAGSSDPFDVWFREQVSQVHGAHFEQMSALPEQHLSLQEE